MLSHADVVALERSVAAESLAEFVKMAWHEVEPEEPYVHGWHIDAVSEHLEAVDRAEITRLLINVPPGTMKSSLTCVFLPAWQWGPAKKPHKRFIGASHSTGNAVRDNRRTKRLVKSDWFQERWPIALETDQEAYFDNAKRGFREACAVASMTGKRGHTVVWDDPINPEAAASDAGLETAERIFTETLPSRVVNPKTSAIIVIMQRLHESDVSGYILANDLGYEHLMLPMEFEPERRCYTALRPRHMPVERKETKHESARAVYSQDPRTEDGELLFAERFPREVVERDKKVLRAYGTAGQFQQRPSPRGGGLFETAKINIIHALPQGYRWARGWDLSGKKKTTLKGDHTAGVLLGQSLDPVSRYCIAHVARTQGTPGEVERVIVSTARQDAAMVPGVRGSLPQDPGQAGLAQVTYLIGKLAGYAYRATPETGDKFTRADPVAAQVEVGNVDMIAGDWNAEFLAELGMFPFGKYDDQVDALSRAFAELLNWPAFEWGIAQD